MRGALPQALLVRGKSTSSRLRLPPRAHAKAVMQAPHRLELWYQVPGRPLRSGTCICRLQSALRSDPGTTPRPAHIARVDRIVMWRVPHVDPRWCISRSASWGRPEHRVFIPRWDWPHSRLVAAGRPQRASQFGPRQCQVGGCHSTFQCRRLRRTVVLPARMRQFCVFSFNCTSRLPVLSLCRCGLSVGCCWHAGS